MIIYLDSSVLARAYLPDEAGHDNAREMLSTATDVLITGTWTRIEVAGALSRAAMAGRADRHLLLAVLLADLSDSGSVTVVAAPQAKIEQVAFKIVTDHGLRAMDAWHLACASITLPELAEENEGQGFASRDVRQAVVAESLGLLALT